MIDKNKDNFGFDKIIRDIFKFKDVEFEGFKFVYWRDYDGYGRPEAIDIKGFLDFPAGLVEGKYSLLIGTAKITNIGENSFDISKVYIVAKFMKNIWSEMTLDFEYSEYWPCSEEAEIEHLTERENKITENIKEALQILSMFFIRFKRHD
jgi:hypothetical protein